MLRVKMHHRPLGGVDKLWNMEWNMEWDGIWNVWTLWKRITLDVMARVWLDPVSMPTKSVVVYIMALKDIGPIMFGGTLLYSTKVFWQDL